MRPPEDAVGRRRLLSVVAILSVIGEVISAFFIEVPLAALVVAALAGWLWIRRATLGAVILIGLLCLAELSFFPTYEREDADDWILQVAFLILGAAGVVAAAALLWRHFRGAPAAAD
jgi:hypothetical protein